MDEFNPRQAAQTRVGMLLRQKWRLERVLGVGGMAAVYAARHRNGHRVAVKVLHASFATDAQIHTRFLREGYAANKVEHPGAVRVLDDDIAEDGAPFLVMELLDGYSLDRALRDGPLTVGEALRVTRRVLEVLVAAHERGIVHRDIKPENVFVTVPGGDVKILDFGIARLREAAGGSTGGTLGGMVLGTPAFMPPEQARGRWEEVDGQSDVWAVGATLMTLLAGRSLRAAETMNEELLLAMNQPLPLAAAALPGIAPEVAVVIDRALAFDKGWRWRTAHAMHEAVRAAEAAVVGRDTMVVGSNETMAPMQVVITPVLAGNDARVSMHEGATLSASPVVAASAGASTKGQGRERRVVWLAAGVIVGVLGGGAAILAAWPKHPAAVAAPEDRAAPSVSVEPASAPVASAAMVPVGMLDAGPPAASSPPGRVPVPSGQPRRRPAASASAVVAPVPEGENPLDRGRH
ncbi:serine/threonine-protein kinase [Pendulispora rubella]|uniref:serine/threonine-protein kinase n=1 Tax=Pendulispora rubella TaxID=2741070 RepID=UPI00374E14F6